MKIHVFKISIIILWFMLLGILLSRSLLVREVDRQDLQAIREARQERYYGVWFQKRRIGYVAETLRPEGTGLHLQQKAHILLNVLDTTQPIDMNVSANLDPNLVLKNFEFHFTSPYYTMQAIGYVEGNTVHFTLDTGHSTITDTVALKSPPLLAVNDRSYLLRQLSDSGQKVKVPSFDPFSLTGRESIITYHGREKLLIRKRVKELHHFSEQFAGMKINFWLDDKGKVVKEESPAGFQFIAEPEFRAKDVVSSGNELLSAVAVPLKGKRPPPGAQQVTYALTIPEGVKLDIDGGRQTFRNHRLTITRENIPAVLPDIQKKCEKPSYFRASRFVQADNERIRNTAQQIVGSETDPLVQVRLIADWIYTNLEKRPVLGLPDAITTLQTKQGDCNEHATLFAALARSLNIPTVIATGVTLQNNAFYYHAWNEVCLGGTWYSLDTTTNQLPADLFHIRFARGDMDEQLQIGALLGKLEIKIISPEKTD